MSERAPRTLDWELAERVALRIAERQPALDARLIPTDASVAHLVGLADQRVRDETRLEPPDPASVRIVDRPTWIRDNLASFRSLDVPVGFGRHAMSVQLGTVLGWMSGRVLGQYDVLLGQGTDSAVSLVGPNLVLLEERHRFDREQFRLWVILHELTHRAQFEGVPWLGHHYRGLIGDVIAMTDPAPGQFLLALRAAARDREAARSHIDEGGLATLFATDEQRAALRSIAALMSLLEGHGDVVMDRAAGSLLPDAPRFAAVLRLRRQQQHPLAKVLLRWVGIAAKLQQYEAGERFIARVESSGDPRMIDRCWEGPELLPTWEEVQDPDLWMQRVGVPCG